jgi:CHAD domain-containing protein
VTDLAPTAIAELEELADGLRRRADVDARVHATRKGIKRLRAFLRLARRSVGKNTYRMENTTLRDAARLIAPARDALVLIETAAAVGAPDAVLAVLAASHREAIAALESGIRTEAADLLRSAAARWRYVAWGGPGAASVRVGLRETYSRGLADLAGVRSDPTDVGFHGWRRRVKYIRYQLETVGAPPAFTRPFTLLGDDLGLEHDHTVLIDVCRTHAIEAGFGFVAEAAERHRDGLRASALELGSSLFAPEPEAYLRTVESLVDLS